jgi:hypothetical protein
MKKGVEIVPEDNYRLKGEDTYEQNINPSFGSKGPSGGSSTANSSKNGGADASSDMSSDVFEARQDFREAS